MEAYQGLAEIYDRLSEYDYKAWTDYLLRLAAGAGVAPKRAADIGCGTGNMAIELAARGVDIVASDLSPAMLRVASEKARKKGLNIPFVRQDMRHLAVHRPLDMAFCACDGINYLTTDAGIEQTFAAACRALRPGGVYLFDIISPYRYENFLADAFFGADYEDIAYIWQNIYDREQGLLTMDISFFVREGQLFRRVVEQHKQRTYGIEHITEALQRAGFIDITVFDAFTEQPAHDHSDRLQFRAVKREEQAHT